MLKDLLQEYNKSLENVCVTHPDVEVSGAARGLRHCNPSPKQARLLTHGVHHTAGTACLSIKLHSWFYPLTSNAFYKTIKAACAVPLGF